MEATSTVRKWPWVKLGKHLRTWMDEETKEAILCAVLDADDGELEEDLEAIEQAGVRLITSAEKYDECEGRRDDSDVSDDEDGVTDLTDDISHLRSWDGDGARKRSAREVAADDEESEENREKAARWLRENGKRKAGKGKKAKRRAPKGAGKSR